ncbi:MAG: hypothetical protein KDC87_01155 [Planctomycetes bacterium]|nr:hypothetical protein [Planctomycetota bacterium]MCB9869302.1 hypothetical protein [Planctomycetota bacterium]
MDEPNAYEGPPLVARRAGTAVSIEVLPPRADFTLEVHAVRDAGDHCAALLVLTGPPEGAPAPASPPELLSVELPDDSRPIHVSVQQRARDTHYFVEPAFALAAVVNPDTGPRHG